MPLAVQVLDLPPYVVGRWVGSGLETATGIAAQAVDTLLGRSGEHLILDFARLTDVSDPVAEALAGSIRQAQRLGRNVCLVRCSDQLYSRLRALGLSGAIAHAGSLLAATHGRTGEGAGTLDLYIRSAPENLHRLRSVVSAVSREAGVDEQTELQVKMAVTEAAANAIRHGSPEGPRNHVRVSFYVEPRTLIVDVSDQGPGFVPEPTREPMPGKLPEGGLGLLMMRQTMDHVEFYRDEAGMLVRMTKYFCAR